MIHETMIHFRLFETLVLICDSTISPHLCILTKGQRSVYVEKRWVHKDSKAGDAQQAVRKRMLKGARW